MIPQGALSTNLAAKKLVSEWLVKVACGYCGLGLLVVCWEMSDALYSPPENVFAGVQKLSPRLRKAIAMYGTTAASTQKEASEIAGLHPQYLTLMLNNNPLAKEELQRVMREVDGAHINVGKLLHQLSLRALKTIEDTMYDASSEALRLKAAQDLADRGPQTSKIQRHQVESFTVDSETTKQLAAAMLESARVRSAYANIAIGSHDATGVSTPGTDESGSL